MNVGIPYYEQIVDWNTAANLALQTPLLFYEEICDLYMMANERKKAREVLEYALERATDENYEELMRRMDKYFN